ncbi:MULTISPECIES: cupin domain-containing protein [Deinococcus]|jgi:mannose-6-phosphate isomerase-like protein (cupin superfamily)|uniref:Cupin n=2 Tax=Deinococcus TaxID=1298 RepID=A0A221T041_9DEIO|nr:MULTISPECIES: cupin domain-containing protein [Deinococcus]ASN82259.1 cupin [Deinococcus ficus]MDP9766386.1 mannose-6-phosphate isomerase-like protein (cupin superfamily) [Deinococcus enclensis]
MDLKPLRREQLNFENGLHAQRLLPWANLNAPFEGSWCVIAPGTASTAHAHHEYEIFIALAGEAWLESEGQRQPFRAGDIVHFTPGTPHAVVNEGTEPFEMYSVWWDLAMAECFMTRHTLRSGG